MTTTITTAMTIALARLRQRVSYVLMRGGDDAPLRLAVDGADVILTLTIPGAAEPAVLGYVWEEDGAVLYERVPTMTRWTLTPAGSPCVRRRSPRSPPSWAADASPAARIAATGL